MMLLLLLLLQQRARSRKQQQLLSERYNEALKPEASSEEDVLAIGFKCCTNGRHILRLWRELQLPRLEHYQGDYCHSGPSSGLNIFPTTSVRIPVLQSHKMLL